MKASEEGAGKADEAGISASVYRELRKLAAAKMRSERDNHTLQPTALVHEAYIRLADQPDSVWKDRGRILALAAKAMRHILVDHAKARAAEKRGAGAVQVSIDEGMLPARDCLVDVLAMDEALSQLEVFDSREAKVLELHFFGGLSIEEIAQEMKISPRTIARDWTTARAWLRRQLSRHS